MTRTADAEPFTVNDVRDALDFNAGTASLALLTLRDILLGCTSLTPERALATARILLAAHTRELAALARQHIDDYRDEHGVTRRTRGLLTGMQAIRRRLDQHAADLDEQVTR
ncbi:hypothetical protein [Streptomyces albofaciens]|uniref:hypothetical protein n=1 Tax=Streptomyces albofaciens TaxID=66866 RepID=UPI001FCA670E|nr:hypothetical protein [Streptomyces albofaciens]